MKLPGPNSGIRWSNYRNTTPTFDLTSIEKPDLSPFLIHMTGKNSLIKILKGENLPEGSSIKNDEGYLKSFVPTFEGVPGVYKSEVVCFTETPIFALDFFRYRSYTRWRSDLQYGIGFSKSALIQHRNVRPVIYLSSEMNRDLLILANKLIQGKSSIIDEHGVVDNKIELFEQLIPLMFPLLEETKAQGFMWEREWRCPNPNGLVFPHGEIKIICCPENERAEIEELLDGFLDNIQIVESWREYDDVTNYLTRRERETDSKSLQTIEEITDLKKLKELLSQNEQTLAMLTSYYDVFNETVKDLEKVDINSILEEMAQKSSEINKQIERMNKQLKKKASNNSKPK